MDRDASGTRTGLACIDVHCHHVPPALLDVVADGVDRLGYEPETRVIHFPSGPARPIPESLLRLPDTRSLGSSPVAMRIVSPWLDIIGEGLDAPAAAVWARVQNDLLADAVADQPKLAALAALPLASADDAAGELQRAVETHGFVGGVIPTQIDGRDLDQVGLDPLFEAAVALDLPLFVHPLKVMGAERMKRFFFWNVCGNPFETTVAAMSLFLGGTFERHPRLKVLLAHGGGTLPWLAGRLARASETGAGGIQRSIDAAEVLACYHYDSVLHDSAALRVLVGAWPDRLMIGSDDPFPMSVKDPLQLVEETGSATDATLHAVAADNARLLFRLK